MEVSLKDKRFICPFCHKKLIYSRIIEQYVMYDCDCYKGRGYSTWAWLSNEKIWKIWKNVTGNWYDTDKIPIGKQVFIFR
jgi:hypothetical protein